MQTIHNIGINDFARGREYALNCTWPELLEEIEKNWDQGSEKEPGVRIIQIDPKLVKGEVVTLKGGEKLIATFEPRKGVNEYPRKSIKGHHSLTPDPVKAADAIVYTKEKLGKDASTKCDWEIVTFRGLQNPNQPQALESLLYNLFKGSGGTEVATTATAEERLAMIANSWLEWHNKVVIQQPE